MIYVIGSSFSSLATVLTLIKYNIDVTVIDVGKKNNNTKQKHIKNLLKKNNIFEILYYLNKFKKKDFNIQPSIRASKSKFGSHFFKENLINDIIEKQSDTSLNMSYAYGGFSNIWGAACLPILKEETTDWPIDYNDLSKYFFHCSKMLNVNGDEDSLNVFFNFKNFSPYEHNISTQSFDLLQRLNQNKEQLINDGIYFGRSKLSINNSKNGYINCVKCGLCMHGCPYDLIFNASFVFDKLSQTNKIQYIDNIKVKSFSENNDEITIYAEDIKKNKPVSFKTKYLFIAAGALSTTKIVMDSLNIHNATIKSKDQYIIPLYLKFKSKLDIFQKINTLSEIFIEVNNKRICSKNIHIQIYPFSDICISFIPFASNFITKFLMKNLNFIFKRIMICQFIIHSDFSSATSVNSTNKGGLTLNNINNPSSKKIVKKLIYFFNKKKSLGFKFLTIFLLKLKTGSSVHLGASFPMHKSPNKFQTDTLGRPKGFRNVHIVDSTVLPELSAATIVFTTVANSMRITEEVAKKISNK